MNTPKIMSKSAAISFIHIPDNMVRVTVICACCALAIAAPEYTSLKFKIELDADCNPLKGSPKKAILRTINPIPAIILDARKQNSNAPKIIKIISIR